MKRRDFMSQTAGFGALVAAGSLPVSLTGGFTSMDRASTLLTGRSDQIKPPTRGKIPVAFAISKDVTVIDFAGPWEVFQDVHVKERGKEMDDQMPFHLFTVSDKTEVLRGSGGLKLVPDYTFETAPQPKIVVVPAQRGSVALHTWLRKVYEATDVTMSVCTGAFQLGKAGLLAGQSATTHHDFLDRFAKTFPDVNVKRGLRFVEGEKISTAGGLSSGIDLALRVVERYFGREVALATATYMEYQSRAWIV
jgi:transcriptional regulator GlxA family with amidase domain